MTREGEGSTRSLDQRAWLVPTSLALSLLFGGLLSNPVRIIVDPSGVIPATLSYALPNQLSAETVVVLFGAPFAALGSSSIAYVGLSRGRAWPYAAIGVAAGVAIFCAIAAACVGIGNWWVDDVTTDTNRVAALFTSFLAPPGTLALILASTSVRVSPSSRSTGIILRFLWLGIAAGTLVGGLVGGASAALTWSVACPQNSFSNCFVLSYVLGDGLVLGGLEGAVIGAVCGYVGWAVRYREPAPRAPSASGNAPAKTD